MNYALAKEIYGESWCIDFGSISTFKNLLREIRTAVHDPNDRANKFVLAIISDSGDHQAISAESKSSSKKEPTISVTNINGPITKSGGSSSYGMKELSDSLISADNDENVLGHLFVIDSPGGSVSGMLYMKQTMESLKKPTVAIIERSGMAASAAYGIAASAKYLFAEDANSEMGSIGVISGTAGVPNGKKNGNGEVEYMVYATTAPDKNKAEVDAINNNDTSGLQERANKLHTEFKDSTKAGRPNILDSQMTGKMYPAGDVVGTMVDAIGSKADAVNKILELSNAKPTFNKNLKNNQTKAMTAQEILAQHPTAHAEIFGAGVASGIKTGTEAEQERVKSWQVYAAIDPEAVNKGIESGKAITQSESHAFLLKSTSKATLDALKTGSNATVATPEAATPEATPEAVAKQKEVTDLFALATINKN